MRAPLATHSGATRARPRRPKWRRRARTARSSPWFTPPRLGTRELAGQATLPGVSGRGVAGARCRPITSGCGPSAGAPSMPRPPRDADARPAEGGGCADGRAPVVLAAPRLASRRRPAAADDADGADRARIISRRRRGARHAVRRGDRGARVGEARQVLGERHVRRRLLRGVRRADVPSRTRTRRGGMPTRRARSPFPITAPHAPLHVALLEEDEAADFLGKSAMNKTGAAGRALTSLAGRAAQATKINAVVEDTPIGRATVRLGALHGRAVYDGWYPLQQTVNTRHVGQHGEVRLRVRVEWKNATPPPPRLARRRAPRPNHQACGAQDVRCGRLYRAWLGERRQIRPRHLQVPRARAPTADVGAQRDERHCQPRDLLRVSHALAAALRLVAARLLASQPDARVLAARRPRIPLADLPNPPPRRLAPVRGRGSACRAVLPRHPPPAATSVYLAPAAAAAATPYHAEQALAGGVDDEEEEDERDGYISEGPSATPRPEPLATKVTAAEAPAERTAEVAAEENWRASCFAGADDATTTTSASAQRGAAGHAHRRGGTCFGGRRRMAPSLRWARGVALLAPRGCGDGGAARIQ